MLPSASSWSSVTTTTPEPSAARLFWATAVVCEATGRTLAGMYGLPATASGTYSCMS